MCQRLSVQFVSGFEAEKEFNEERLCEDPSQQPRLRARELEQRFHVVFIGVELA